MILVMEFMNANLTTRLVNL